MGNDKCFVEAQDLPFRLVNVPVGSAPPPPSSPLIPKSHTQNKGHAPPVPPRRVQGYDAPPSLLPPPIVPKRFDEPIILLPPRSDLPPSRPTKTTPFYPSKKTTKYHRRMHKPKIACCVIC